MQIESKLISIIIPVYNTETYVEAAIQSVLQQSLDQWELLLIDDGSTDASGRICDEYMHGDERIRVFHTENRGVSSARNLGLSHATGEWLYFLDSDDCLEIDALQTLLEYSEGADVVMGRCPYEQVPPYLPVEEVIVFDAAQASAADKEKLFYYGMFFSVCDKLFRRSHFNSTFRSDLFLGEDIFLLVDRLPAWRRVVLLPKVLYNRRWRRNSAVHVHRLDYIRQMQVVYGKIAEVFSDCRTVVEQWSWQYVNTLKVYCLEFLGDSKLSIWERYAILSLILEKDGFDGAVILTDKLNKDLRNFWRMADAQDIEGLLEYIDTQERKQR